MGITRCLAGAVCLLLAFSAKAQDVSFKDLARQMQYQQVKIAPDGRHLAAIAVIDDKPLLALVDLDTHKGGVVHPREGEQVVGFWWVNPDRVVYSVGMKVAGFDQPVATGELFAVNADGSSAATLFGYRAEGQSTGTLVQHATAEYASATMIDTLRDDRNHVLIGVDDWNTGAEGSFTQVYSLDVRDGIKHRVLTAPLRNAGFMTDHQGVVRFAYGYDGKAKYRVFYRENDQASWTLLFSEDEHGIVGPLGFDKGDATVLMSCGRAGAVDAICPWDVATQKLQEPVWSSPSVDADGLETSLDRQQVVGVRSMPGTPAVSVLQSGADSIKLIQAFSQQFPGEFVDVVSSSDDGSKAVLLVSSDTDPGTFYLWDANTGKASALLQRAGWIHPERMARMQPIELKARDGLPLHGYLTRPPGKENAKHLPLVVYVHGGPFGIRDVWDYDAYVQMLATHGYAVLQVNYRGSGGFGYDFMHAGYRQWGGSMQDDVTDATRWAIDQGFADGDRICIFGGSYGGYAALEGVMKEPGLYKCAIGYVGVYDLGLMYKRGDDTRSSFGMSALHKTVGDDPTSLAAHSPINQLDRLRAQTMLIVGGRDERVPPIQGENLHQAMLKRHIAHEWLYKSDEGHGFYSEANRAELFEHIVDFLDRNIGRTANVASH